MTFFSQAQTLQYLNGNFETILIVGYKRPMHTHHFIHKSFYRAFLFLGLPVKWVESIDVLELSQLKKTLVLSSSQYFPRDDFVIHSSSKALIHNIEQSHFFSGIFKHEVFSKTAFALYDNDFISLGVNSGFSCNRRTVVTMWGTDLLYNVVSQSQLLPSYRSNDKSFFVGTKQGPLFSDFNNKCVAQGFKLASRGGFTGSNNFSASRLLRKLKIPFFVDDFNSIKYTLKSVFAFDIRERGHLESSYIPCRIFKTLSYGRLCLTNSLACNSLFPEYTFLLNDDTQLADVVELESSRTHAESFDIINYMISNHSYVNRVQEIASSLASMDNF